MTDTGKKSAGSGILVIGGTNFIGRLLVTELCKAGHQVTILHRQPAHDFSKKVTNLQADRNDADALRSVLAGRSFEYVFDNVYDWERGTTANQVEATAKLVADGLKQYIFLSSVAAYGDGLNHHEGDALAPDDHPDPYVRNKATTERCLFRLHQRTGFPVVTLRPPFVYGPGNPYYREAFFWDRLRDDRSMILPGDGRRLMQFVHVKDLVHACLQLLETTGVAGHAFNIGNARPLAQLELVDLLAKVAGKEPKYVRLSRDRIFRAGGHPMGPNLYFGMYYDLPAITMVINRAQRILKFKPTDFLTGLREEYRWYLKHRIYPEPDYTFEDALIAAAPPSAYAAPEW